MSPDSRSREYRNHLEAFLRERICLEPNAPQKTLFDSMQYSLFAGGKRLRPLLTLEFCRISGGNWQNGLPFAAAVEMIHTYSLIHDDLPCMDNDDFRRGKPTNHKVFGQGIAVLAGDALLTDAFAVAASCELPDPGLMPQAIALLAECAGSLGMVGGQVLDMESENRLLTEAEVLDIQSRKTGCLIRAACCLGVLAAGGSSRQLKSAGQFAHYLGLAFQIRDDMLDVIGTQAEMGKDVGTDAGKNTFVRLYGLKKCEKLVQSYTNMALQALESFEDRDYLTAMAVDLTARRN